MLRFLNKKIRNNPLRKFLIKWEEDQAQARACGLPDPRRGQVAIILILISAIALIFFIVAFNLGRVSQAKTQTTIAANVATAQMASLVASYGQSLYMGQMGGQTSDCGWTGFFMAVVDFVAGTIIGFIKGGIPGAIMGAIQGAMNIALQVTAVDKYYSNYWNSIFSDTFSMRDGFIEQGINTALQTATSDTAKVPDLTDIDADRLWGPDPSGGGYLDHVSRYAFYYGERLKKSEGVDARSINYFMDELRDLLYFTTDPTDTWAFFDYTLPTACQYDPIARNAVPSFCNPCCVPTNAKHPWGRRDPQDMFETLDYRPSCCDTNDSETECGRSDTCLEYSSYKEENADFPPTHYEYVYDPYLENWENTDDGLISFREALGRDDEHQYYYEDPPIFYTDPPSLMEEIAQVPYLSSTQKGFFLPDASSFWDGDMRTGSYPFFYKIADWGVDLTQLDYSAHPEHCYWYNEDFADCQRDLPVELDLRRLKLIEDPADLIYNWTNFVDSINTPRSSRCAAADNCPALAPDKVILKENILAKDNECAQDALYPTDTGHGFWKKGADMFCSPGDNFRFPDDPDGVPWPYDLWCEKQKDFGDFGICTRKDEDGNEFPVNCTSCAESGKPEMWPDDVLDDIVYKVIPAMVELENMLGTKDVVLLAKSFADWYPQVADWIEPSEDDVHSHPDKLVCYECPEEQGTFWVLLDVFEKIEQRLRDWRNGPYIGSGCDEVWCVPPWQDTFNEHGQPECRGVTSGEAQTFNADPLSGRGDIGDIVACLNWNIEDQAPNGAMGNAEKFARCRENCTHDHCQDLPRSLLPPALYESSSYRQGSNPALEPDIPIMIKCFDECSNDNCRILPVRSQYAPWPGTGNPADFDESNDCNNWDTGNDWYDTIILNLRTANTWCDLDEGLPDTLNDDGWLALTGQSAREAENQVAKFRTRRDFLQRRLAEVDHLLGRLDEAEKQLNDFLSCGVEPDPDPDNSDDGPACALIKARMALDNTGLPYHAIYAWQSDPPPNRDQGYWHVVRVDGRLSGKCDMACGPGGERTGESDPWPHIEVVQEDSLWGDLGLRGCFELQEKRGMVKMRVTRFDEERDANKLIFPAGKLPIWDFKSGHPSRASYSGDINQDINSYCEPNFTVHDPDHPDIYKGAFILNEKDPDHPTCWDIMNQALVSGVTSETCAEYYFETDADRGFTFKFVPCGEF